MGSGKFEEVLAEFRLVLSGGSNLVDAIIPPLLFVMMSAFLGFDYAMWGSLGVALLIMAHRWRKGESLWHALGGVGGVGLAILLAQFFDRAEAYFLPGIITGALTVIVAVISNIVGRPMVAWSSSLTRRWPLGWYWHPQIRPAYSEVTWLWALYFALRLLLQLALFQIEAPNLLAIFNLISGWPATIALLVASYLYGTWRLRNLKGPSVDEFKTGAPPPWEGQQRGF
ncbi:MAG: DUF3159 domain-containing protein [Ardenticatenaceae bacterium]